MDAKRRAGRRPFLYLLIVLMLAAGAATWNNLSRPTMSLENAIQTDFQNVKKLHQLSASLETEQPTTEEELEEWVKRAQKVREESLQLVDESTRLREKTLANLNEFEPTSLREATRDYFEAEIAYFKLMDESEGETQVMLFKSGDPSEEDERHINAMVATIEALFKGYSRVLECQDRIIAEAQAQGLSLQPVWEASRLKELQDGCEMMRDFKR